MNELVGNGKEKGCCIWDSMLQRMQDMEYEDEDEECENLDYKVKITPGRRKIVDPEEMDPKLICGCEEAAKCGTDIYVCGNHGSGKTTVMNYFFVKAPELFGVKKEEALFFQAEELTDRIIQGIIDNSLFELREKLRKAKVILIDNIDRLEDKRATQNELRSILEKDKLVILSGTEKVYNLNLQDEILGKIESFTIMEIERHGRIL